MYTTGDVMDMAAAVLNDSNRAVFNYAVQLPYLRMANRNLEQDLILNEIPLSLADEVVIPVSAGAVELDLPPNFFLPITLAERALGASTTNFSKMTERTYADDGSILPAISNLSIWDFRHNCINFNSATTDREVKLNYWRTLPPISNENQTEYIAGAINTLGFKTAEYCAKYIGGNIERAQTAFLDYQDSFDKLVGIFVKNNQGKRVRRKPFRVNSSGYRFVG